jgi:hypothetical protein
MGYWGWRPMAFTIFVCVWVAGCNLASDMSPTIVLPSPYPLVTLTRGRPPIQTQPTQTNIASAVVSAEAPTSSPATEEPTSTPVLYIVQEGDTLLDIALLHNVSLDALRAANAATDLSLLQIGQALIIPQDNGTTIIQPSPTPLSLSIQPPSCSETRVGATLCLGTVNNLEDIPAGRVTIEVRLLRPDGAEPLIEIATVEQALIPPGEFAPYRVLFNSLWSDFTGATAVLRSADAAFDSSIVPLAVENQRGQFDGGRFEVTADLVNTGDQTIQPVRAVVTLQNDAGEVIGYRVAALGGEALPPGGRLPLEVELVPQVYPSTPLRVKVYAEGRAV